MKILITGGKGNIATIIKNSLFMEYDITNPSHAELDLLDFQQLTNFLKDKSFDVLIHTAILGGRRTKEDESISVYKNLLMFENLMKFANEFKMIINLDSAAIYDRSTDIMNRKENELLTIPTDYYGFSKYLIYKRTESFSHIFNFRIFNIFHENEEPDRFIKTCFHAIKYNTDVIIPNDKYFDFVYKDDFIIVLKHYLQHCFIQDRLEKTVNISYEEKYKLSDIANMIFEMETIERISKIIVLNNDCTHNYCGVSIMKIQLNGLKNGLILYRDFI